MPSLLGHLPLSETTNVFFTQSFVWGSSVTLVGTGLNSRPVVGLFSTRAADFVRLFPLGYGSLSRNQKCLVVNMKINAQEGSAVSQLEWRDTRGRPPAIVKAHGHVLGIIEELLVSVSYLGECNNPWNFLIGSQKKIPKC